MSRTSGSAFHRHALPVLTCIAFAALLSQPAKSQSSPTEADVLALSDVRLIDGQGGPPLQAIHIATANAAALLQLSDRGVIAPGKLADLLVVDGNPAAQIQDLHRIIAVYHRGKQVSTTIESFTP